MAPYTAGILIFSKTLYRLRDRPQILFSEYGDFFFRSKAAGVWSWPLVSIVVVVVVAAGRSPAEILGSNPTGGMDICLLWVSCVVR